MLYQVKRTHGNDLLLLQKQKNPQEIPIAQSGFYLLPCTSKAG